MPTLRRLAGSLALAATIVATLVVGLPGNAQAASATYVVTTTVDDPDARPGDGACRTRAGACSLRAAMTEAFLRPLQHTTVVVPAGRFELTRKPAMLPVDLTGPLNGSLDIGSSMTIRGAGARRTVIDANRLDRIFTVITPTADVTIQDMTLTGGLATQRELLVVSGGGAIANQGRLTLRRMTITDNRADYGGGLFNTPSSSATVIASTVSHNIADLEAGGIRFDASGSVINSTIAHNRVLDATCCPPGITYPGGTRGEGGGIDVRGFAGVSIVNSTIVGNHAAIGGGGLNRAPGYTGDLGTGVLEGVDVAAPVTVRNTIIAGNTSTTGGANCEATLARIASAGGNIDSGASCGFDGPGDQSDTAPALLSLADHGGPTDTYLPRRSSPARGVAANCPATDQRARPRSSPCDVGSVEVR